MLKHHPTKQAGGDVERFMAGDLDYFITAAIMPKPMGTVGAAAPAEE
jgi:hypothetical protein